MVKIKEVLQIQRQLFPEDNIWQEGDNVGLLVGCEEERVEKVILALDANSTVINEAKEKKANLILSHHPFIYMPINRITSSSVLGANILFAIKNNISIYSAHTNLDFTAGGVNDYAASALGLSNIEVAQYYKEAVGVGRKGNIKSALEKFAKTVAISYNDKTVRFIGDANKQIQTVLVLNGGCGGETKYVDMALSIGADCLVTADVKHHVGIYAIEKGISIVEASHYSMEKCFIKKWKELLIAQVKKAKLAVEIIESETEKDLWKN